MQVSSTMVKVTILVLLWWPSVALAKLRGEYPHPRQGGRQLQGNMGNMMTPAPTDFTTTEPTPVPAPTPAPAPTPVQCFVCVNDPFVTCSTGSDCTGIGDGICNSKSDNAGATCSTNNDCPPNRGKCVGECVSQDCPTLAPAPAGIFYVSSAAEITSVSATAGDTIVMMESGNWDSSDIVLSGAGTSGSPITLTVETSNVILTGASRLRIGGSYVVVDGLNFEGQTGLSGGQQAIEFRASSSDFCDNCRLTNTSIKNYNPTQSSTDTRWVGLHGTNNRVDHCLFEGKNNQGPLLVVWRSTDNEDFHTIDRNVFQDFASGGGLNGWETIRIGTSTTSLSDSSSTISQNLFLRCNGEIEIISVKSGNNVLEGNTFDSCDGMLTLRHGKGNTVLGNFFLGRGLANTGGVRLIDSDHVVVNNYMEGLRGTNTRSAIVLTNGLQDSQLNGYFSADRCLVAFNTIYDCKETVRIGWRSSSNVIPVTNSTIANNAVHSFSFVASTIVTEEDTPVNMVYEGNIMWGDGVPLGISATTTQVQEVDPQLVLGSGGLYRPDAASPCLDAALGASTVTSDMDGQSRAAPLDVGADEVSNDSVTSGPLSLSDVGTAIGPLSS